MRDDGPRARYRTLAQVVRRVEQFENGTLRRTAWNHAMHLTVLIWYLLHFDEAEACERMIRGIRAYNRKQGIAPTRTGGYHETITLFWLAITRHFVAGEDTDRDPLELINRFVGTYDVNPRLHLDYYSPRLIRSWRARHCWVAPDLRPLNL